MAIRYKYDGNTYTWSDKVRQAIWDKEHVAFGQLTPELMEKFGVVQEEYNPEDELTDDQIAMRVRSQRDHLLNQTDFYLMPDYEITSENLEAVKEYRKLLRDLPQQEGFPRTVTWPTFPAALSKQQQQ